ncbi:MAG TPA: DUF4143 domain-containing protein, partial [Syntrophorhabdaceae bacterium]|nr:DUF4143 domain-containing protein [Syntrophorhabdaceae bacterium]HQH43716.1 DUF4143 domain-containing protein [Syntrophorhabdaceae bacterium]
QAIRDTQRCKARRILLLLRDSEGFSREATCLPFLFENGPVSGAIFENYIISEIIKQEIHRAGRTEFYFFRTGHGDEIDLIVDKKNKKTFIEIRNSFTFKPMMLKTLK